MSERALDVYCGDGGASMGLAEAGFDVDGVDRDKHPCYPFQLFQSDAVDSSQGCWLSTKSRATLSSGPAHPARSSPSCATCLGTSRITLT